MLQSQVARRTSRIRSSGSERSSELRSRLAADAWYRIGPLSRRYEGNNLIMLKSRRNLLKSVAGTAGTLAAAPWMYAAFQHPQPMPSPNAPNNQNFPGGLNGPPVSNSDKPATNTMNGEQIAAMV